MIRKLIILQFLVFAVLICKSQDPYFVLTKNVSVYLNPAFTGFDECNRVVSMYQNRYPALGRTYQTYYLSYDQKVKEIFGGLSIRGMYDSEGDGAIRTKSVYSAYSSNIKLFNDKLLICPAIEFGIIHNKLNLDFIFPHMIHPEYGHMGNSSEIKNPVTVFDINSGLVIAHHNLIYGVSFHHITQPKYGFYNANKLPLKYTIHASYVYNLNDKLRISPIVLYQSQKIHEFYSANISFAYNNLMSSIGIRLDNSGIRLDNSYNVNAYNINLGYKLYKFIFGYSYVLFVSKLSNQKLGSHEFSATFNFNCKNKEENNNKIEFINF